MPIKAITIKATPLESFAQRVSESLAGRELGKIVKVQIKGTELFVTFQKLGSSELTFAFKETSGNTLKGELTKEKIAFTHRAFRQDIENKLAKVLLSCGAEVS